MYRVFEALDELVTSVEEARGLPMTASCVVPFFLPIFPTYS